MKTKMNFTNAGQPILNIVNKIETMKYGGLDLQPDYQRGFIWGKEFKDKLIFSVIKQYPIGNISIRSLDNQNNKGAKEEVVDGQQRLTTIYQFVRNEYPISSEWSKRIIDLIIDYYDGDLSDPKLIKLMKKKNLKGPGKIYFSDLPNIIQGNIHAFNIAITYIANSTDEEIREYFRFLQNQERLRAGEIIKSIPPTSLSGCLSSLVDKNMFLKNIGFVDNRLEFDKVFYSIVGLFDQKINFGIADKAIQKYTESAKMPELGSDLISNMSNQINHLSFKEEQYASGTRKRFLKYFLLLSGFNLVDFTSNTSSKIKLLKQIDDALASFFSAKPDEVNKALSYASNQVIEELRHVALLTKGTHQIARVKNRCDVLAYYINNCDFRNPSGLLNLSI